MGQPNTRQTALQRLLSSNTTAANFVTSDGLLTPAEMSAVGIPFVDLEANRSIDQISFFGVGADNSTLLWKLVMVYMLQDYSGRVNNQARDTLPALYELRTFASGTAVLSTMVGEDGCVVDDGERIADSVGVVTLTNWGQAMQDIYGSTPVTYNPADNTRAFYAIPDAGSVRGFFIDLKLGTCTQANALFRLVT